MAEQHRGPRGRKGEKGDPGVTPLDELTSLLRSERARWRSWFLVLAALVAAVGVLGWQQGREGEARERKACEVRQDFGVALRGVVEFATEPAGLDFAEVPGFDDLDSATQVYVRHLTGRLAGGSNDRSEALREFTAGLVPVETC